MEQQHRMCAAISRPPTQVCCSYVHVHLLALASQFDFALFRRDFSCWVHSFSTWRKEAAKSWLCKASCALVLCNTNKSHKSLFFCLWSCVYPADTGHRIHLQTWNFNLLWLTMQQIIFVVWTVLWWKRISDRVFRQPVSQRSSFRTAFPIVPSKSQPCLSSHVELLARWSSSCFLSLWGWARPFDLCP